ncbi:MAG: hypothetical protein EOO02_10695 [Chitinophagaceae bacterium]|nr:MAG: hypothetical protein EOO02_10695 [Chitinophagaceae bacterium]
MNKQTFNGVMIALLTTIAACNTAPETKPSEQGLPEKPKFDEATETAAIMKVIDGETDCFFKGDYDCWAKHWSHESYAFQAWNNSDGTADAAVGWDKINAQGKGWIEKYYKNGKNVIHPDFKRGKPMVKFYNENAAYLIWKQYNADKEKKFYRTSQETRLMEKDNEGWKIVSVAAFWDTQKKIATDSLRVE